MNNKKKLPKLNKETLRKFNKKGYLVFNFIDKHKLNEVKKDLYIIYTEVKTLE